MTIGNFRQQENYHFQYLVTQPAMKKPSDPKREKPRTKTEKEGELPKLITVVSVFFFAIVCIGIWLCCWHGSMSGETNRFDPKDKATPPRVESVNYSVSAYMPKQKMAMAIENKQVLDDFAIKIKSEGEDLCKKIDLAIGSISKHSFHGERLTLAIFEKIAAELIGEVQDVISAHESFAKSTKEYENLLKKIRPHFGAAEIAFREFAANEPYTDLKANYLQLAEIAFGIDQKLAVRELAIAPGVKQVNSSLQYIKRTEVFLHRLSDFLAVIPKHEIDAELFVDRLGEYVERFQKMQDVLKRFSNVVGDDAEKEEEKDQPSVPIKKPFVQRVMERLPKHLVKSN